MNIFYLDTRPKEAAMMHCDKHCVKMILETAQLLSTAHRELDGDCISRPIRTIPPQFGFEKVPNTTGGH